MANLAEDRVPVIIGIGQVNDRPDDPFEGLDSLGLMLAALREAEGDAGVPVLGRLDWLGVEDQISFPNPDIHLDLAAMLPAKPAKAERTSEPSGDGPVQLLNDAANLIASGQARIAAIAGGEAMRTANKRRQAELAGDPGGAAKPDLLQEAAAAIALPHARPYGLLTPADIYPLYENATRAAWGQSLEEAQAESGAIWAGNAQVAAANPHAWLRRAPDAAEIIGPSAENRMISFPYTKLMVANNAVNQGAAVIVASLAAARGLGVPEDRLVYVGRGVAAHEPDDYLRRESYARSPSVEFALAKVLALNGLTAGDLDHVELYSCFPCVPKIARRVLGWPLEKPHSVYGGLTFGGGPIGNCMMHGVAAMVEKLREGRDDGAGLVFANGGFATHNHVIVLTRRPGEEADSPHDYDYQREADAGRGPIPEFLESYAGPGTLESYVMSYGRGGAPAFAAVVARTPSGERFLAHVPGDDREMLDFLACSKGEPVGSAGRAVPMEDGRARWLR